MGKGGVGGKRREREGSREWGREGWGKIAGRGKEVGSGEGRGGGKAQGEGRK